MRPWKLALLPLALLAASQAQACYVVYDRGNSVVYQSERAPVDMSRELHETVPARFGAGSHMMFDSADCAPISSVATGNGGRTRSLSPLLTNEKVAQAQKIPHENLGNGIALVAAGDAVMRPGITVVPGDATNDTALASAGPPDTRTLGAGPARPARAKRGAEITEYRQPPLVVTRRGNNITISTR